MNMLDIQDKLKGLSEQQLVQAMQAPAENVPQFLVLSEITRRKRMRDSMASQEGNGMTVAQEAVAAAGVPQGGIADMARAMAPKTDMTQNTGVSSVQGMYAGGPVYGMDYQEPMGEEFVFDAREPLDVQGMYGGGPVMKMAAGDLVTLRGIQYIEQPGGGYLRYDGGDQPADIELDEIVVTAPDAAPPSAPPAPTPQAPQPQRQPSSMMSGASSYESEIKDAMERAERRAKQDKWMALAQVGLGLMSSQQPTIAGAIGEAGLAGLESYRGARDSYEKERLGLSKELSSIEAARASQRAAAAKAAAGPTPQARMKAIKDEMDFLMVEDEFGGSAPRQGFEDRAAQLLDEYNSLLGQMYGNPSFDATAQ
jgi:hypothetical protein